MALPLKNPKPDAKHLIDVVMGRTPCDRVPLVEYIIDDVHIKEIARRLNQPFTPAPTTDMLAPKRCDTRYLDNMIQCWHHLGYDYVRIERNAGFQLAKELADDIDTQKERSWVESTTGLIESWDDFERYPWPSVTDECFADIEYINDHLPDGMGLISSHCAGVYEHLSFIMGYETLCIALYESPDLVQAVTDRIGDIMVDFYRKLVQFDRLVAVWPGDDMGFKTGTLIRPEQLIQYILPHHKRFAEIAHNAGLPYFLHSCGNVLSIMDNLIDDVKIDAKHSFEDVIIPIADFQKRFGDRIGVLGGVDVDILTKKSPDDIRAHTRKIIDTCAPRGRFAIGSGNSIPSYVPTDNYLAMIDEALKT